MKISDIEIFVHGKTPISRFVTITFEKEEHQTLMQSLRGILHRCEQGLENPNVSDKTKQKLTRQKEVLSEVLKKFDDACLRV